MQTHLDSNLRSIETSCVAELRAGERAISTAYRLVYGKTLSKIAAWTDKSTRSDFIGNETLYSDYNVVG